MITKKKVVSFIGYMVAASVGFALYYVVRTQFLPLFGTGTISSELDIVRSKLPITNKEQTLILNDISYDDSYNTMFYVSYNISVTDIQELEKNFKSLQFTNTLCNNRLSQLILKKGGSLVVRLKVDNTELSKDVKLNCEITMLDDGNI